MLQWLFYVGVVTALLSVAGVLTEGALRKRHLPTRWVWAVTIGLIVLLAYLSIASLLGSRLSEPRVLQHSWRAIQHVAPVRLPELMPPPVTAVEYTHALQWNTALASLWILMSVLVLMTLMASAVHVYWRRSRWPMQLLGRHCVGISPDIGPAVVGLLRPTIVIPRWVLDKNAREQQLIVAHEASHLQARDPLLLTAALVALVLMPWNPALWWQLHRLRHAIEVDCDARVLDAGNDTQIYGEALIEVGQRRSGFVGTVAAMSESRTLLEKRIEIMAQRHQRPWTYGFAALCALAIAIAGAAAQVAAPDAAGTRKEIDVDAATLDKYVGKYQLAPTSILAITRDGAQLKAQITGQPTLPIYAETPTKFFWKIVDAQVTFSVGDSGVATSATIHQHGRDIPALRMDEASAQALEQQLKERLDSQQPQAGSEAALRKTIAALQAGVPNYADMTPLLQDLTRQQLPVLTVSLKDLGSVQSIEFRGVGESGADKYVVTHESAKKSQWLIQLNPDGKIATLAVLPVF